MMRTLNGMMLLLFRLLFRIRVTGLERLDFSRPTIIMPNHVSLLDGAFLAAVLPPETYFVVNKGRAGQFGWLMKGRNILEVEGLSPFSIRTMIRALQRGLPLVIFPEGRMSTTGGLMKIYQGAGFVAARTGAQIYPVAIDGPERSAFSPLVGKVRTVLFPPVSIAVGAAFGIPMKQGLRVRDQKRLAADRILTQLRDHLLASRLKQGVNLHNELVEAARTHGWSTPIAEDMSTKLSYRKLVLGAVALGNRLNRLLQGEETVGLMLPTSAGATVALFALFRGGKSPALLNFTTGSAVLQDCMAVSGVRTVLTSRVFVEKAGLEALVKAVAAKARVIYLEDVRAQIGTGARLAALLTAYAAPATRAPAGKVILFTSGSESKPKGVVHTHDSLFANIHQARVMMDITARDKVLNVLPVFHSFGLTPGTLLPLICGIKVMLYPSPLHYRVIPELAYDRSATILFGTSTFLSGYARKAHHYDFHSLRYVFAGAEPLRPEVSRLYLEKFGVRILEGYGTTEAAPLVAMNSPLLFKPGTVGQLVPGMEYQLREIEGIATGGELMLRGPNLMQGYLKYGEGFVPVGDWYPTGDVFTVDEEGFLTIRSRIKRFAKLGGEMVPLGLIEELAAACFGHDDLAVVVVKDARKGERTVLFTQGAADQAERFRAYLAQHGHSALLAPQRLVAVKELPRLGTGKVDYTTLTQMAQEQA